MGWIEPQGVSKPCVDWVDREGDSVGHMRQWSSEGYHFLNRAKNAPRVQYEGKSQQLCKEAEPLTDSASCEVTIKGKKAIQWVSETQVILTRPAQQQKHKDGQRVSKTVTPGEPLP